MGIALLGLTLNFVIAFKMALTNDEQHHISYGAAILKGSADRSSFFFDSKMPVSMLNAIPGAFAGFLQSHGYLPKWAQLLRDVGMARCPTVLAAFALSLLVYLYAESLYGRQAALFAQLLFLLSPNIAAHSALATTDLYAACGFVLFLYCLRRYLQLPNRSRAAMAAAALAAAQLTKFVSIFLYPALGLILGAVALSWKLGWQDRYRVSGRSILQFLAFHALFFLAFVNAAFLFDRTLTPLAKYDFHDERFRALQRIPVLRAIPLPVPYPYIQGFDMMNYGNNTGDLKIMLLGEVRGNKLAKSGAFPLYYLVCYALKEPIGMQLLFLVAIWILRNRRCGEFLAGEFPLLLSAGVLVLWLSLFSKTQIGIRHILPALVIFVILSGAAFAGWAQFERRKKLLLGACLLYVTISVATYFPHMIPYFNEILTDRKMAYRYLADSNLEWGQDDQVVHAYLGKNRDVRLNPNAPVSGRILVSANLVAGIGLDGPDYWVRRLKLQPIAHVGYGHLLFLAPSVQVGSRRSMEMTPSTGKAQVGANQTLKLTVTNTAGIGDLTILDLLINNAVDVHKACYLAYVFSNNTLFLVNDAGDAGGPFAGTMPLGKTNVSIQNSQCRVNSATVNLSGNTLTMTLNLAFRVGFTGHRFVYAAGQDAAGRGTAWQSVATWTVQ